MNRVLLTDAVWIFIKNKVHPLFPNAGIRRKATQRLCFSTAWHCTASCWLQSHLYRLVSGVFMVRWPLICHKIKGTLISQFMTPLNLHLVWTCLFVLAQSCLLGTCFLHGSFGFSELIVTQINILCPIIHSLYLCIYE